MRYRDLLTDEWTSMSWNKMLSCVNSAAAAMCSLGVEVQGRVCVFTQNCPEVLITHFAAFNNRAVPVSIYATSSHDEAKYIVDDSGATRNKSILR